MTFLRFVFVILLCIPVAYVALRLIYSLIDKTVYEARHGVSTYEADARRSARRGDSYDDIQARADARRAEREEKVSRKRSKGGRR